MASRDHELMKRRLGADVLEGQHIVVAIGDGRGDLTVADLAE
jgi:hypothetical protein